MREEKELKRWLKRKISITLATVIAFAITGGVAFAGSVAVGKNVQKISTGYSWAVKEGATASGTNSTAVGDQTTATGENSTAVGFQANASGTNSTSIGSYSTSSGKNSVALGRNSKATQTSSISIGNDSKANSNFSVTVGTGARIKDTSATQSVAIGAYSQASGEQSIAIGGQSDATFNKNLNTEASGAQAIAIGGNVKAEGDSSIAIGGDDTVVVGKKTVTYDKYDADGSVEGEDTDTLSTIYSTLTGDSQTIGNTAYPTTKTGEGAISIGTSAEALGGLSVAFGIGSTVDKKAHLGVALGTGAHSSMINAVAIGAGSLTDVKAKKYTEASVKVLDENGNETGEIINYKGFTGGAEKLQPGDYVSFGKKDHERQLKNVAAGEVSADSTDAINGSQLVSVGNTLKNKINALKDELNNSKTVVEAKDKGGALVKGAGTTTDPYKVSVVTDNATIEKDATTGALKVKDNAITSVKIANGTILEEDLNRAVASKLNKVETVSTDDANLAIDSNNTNSSTGKDFKLSLAKDLRGINSISNGGSTLRISSTGFDVGNKKITGVLAGTEETDAVNKSQLDAVEVKAGKKSVETVSKGTGIEVTETGGANGKNYEISLDTTTQQTLAKVGENESNIGKNLAKIDKNISDIKETKKGLASNKKLIDANDKELKAQNTRLTTAERSIVTNKNSIDANTQGVSDNLVKINTNISAIEINKKEIAKKLNKDELKNITGTGIEVTNSGDITKGINLSISDNAITTAKIKDANVTKEKLAQSVQDTLSKVGKGAVADGDQNTVTGDVVKKALDDKADKTLGNITDEGKAVITDLTDVTNGDDSVTVTSEIDPTSKKKTYKVKANLGEVDATNTSQAVSGSKVKTYVDNKGLTFSGNTGSKEVKLDNTVSVEGLNNDISVEAKADGDNAKLEVTLNKETVVNDRTKDSTKVATTKAVYEAIKDSKTVVEAKDKGGALVKGAGTTTDPYKVSVVTDNATIEKDATTGALKVKDNAITSVKIANGTILEEDLNRAVASKLNKVETVSTDDANLAIDSNNTNSSTGKDFKLSLAKDLRGINSISNGESTLRISSTGFDVGNKKVSNLADGTALTDAVNLKQLNEIEKKAVKKSVETVSKGTGIEVTETGGANGKNYEVSLDTTTQQTLAKVGENESNIGKNLAKIDKNISDIKETKKGLASNKKLIDANDKELKAQNTRLTTAERSIVTNKNSIDANTQGVSDNLVKINTNISAIEINKKEIAKKLNKDELKNIIKDIESKDGSVLIGANKNVATGKVDLKVNIDGKTIKLNSKGQLQAVVSAPKVDETSIEINKTGEVSVKDGGITETKLSKNIIEKLNQKSVETVSEGNGIKVNQKSGKDGKDYKVSLAKDITNINSITLGNKAGDDIVSISKDKGINAGRKKITNLASGLEGKTLSEIKKEGTTSSQWNNAATIGDLTTVQNNVNINNKTLGTNVAGEVIGADGKILEKGLTTEKALTTYDVSGQKERKTNSVITAVYNMNEQGIKFFHTNDGKLRKENNDSNKIDSSAGGRYATAVGYKAKAKGDNSLAIGNGSEVAGKQSIAIGTGNKVNGNNSGAIGDPSIIDSNNSYSVGNNNELATGTDNSFVLGNDVKIGKGISEIVALGNKAKVEKSGSVALGANSVAGKAHEAKGNIESSYTYAATADKQVAGKPTKETSTVSVGSVGKERQVQNVAAGVISKDSTDAVNGSQLYYTNRAILQNVGNTINNVNKKIDSVNDRLQGGIAGTTAMAGIEFMEIGINQATVAAAVGGYRGKHSVAVGLEAAPTVNTRVNAKAAITPINKNVDYQYSVGAAYRFNWK